jgi:signal transduction histidine kinase/CheY-like chemotaxis protein
MSGGGHTGALLRAFDWSSTPLGQPLGWPQPLKTVTSIILGSNQPMFVVWGPQASLIYNDAYAEILNRKHPSALGQPFLEVWHEIKGELSPIVTKAYDGEPLHMVDIELHLDRKGFKEEAHFAFSYTPVRDESGAIGGFFCACTETTSQVLADRKAAADTARQRRLFQQAPGFITILSQSSHIFEFVNDSYVKLFGNRDYIGRTVREVFPDLEGQGFFEWLDDAYRTGKRHSAYHVNARLRTVPEGPEVERFLDFIYEPVVDEDGRITGIFCEGYDVTESHEAQAALRKNEAQLRDLNATLEQRVAVALAERRTLAEIVEATDVLIQVIDPNYRWIAINRASADEFEAVHGVRPKAGDSLLSLLEDPDERARQRSFWARALAGEAFTHVDEYKRSDRESRCYERKFNVLRDAQGERIGAYQFVYDVTDRLRREAELAQAQEALRQSQKMDAMGQLTGGVAHDFNNLLMPIIGSLDMLQRKGAGDVRLQRMIDGALQSAERAKTLVQRLLAFARRQPLQAHALDVGSLVHGMYDLLASTVGPRVEISLHVPSNLPSAVADANQLEMALLNLAVNARDAMPEGGTLTIALAAETVEQKNEIAVPAGPYLRLSVRDTGVGMDKATRDHATEPFFSTKGVGRGTGLGLSMVHGLAAQLGGALTIESEPGKGTTIQIWLPLGKTAALVPTPAFDSDVMPGSGTILLVDDEPIVRASTAEMLRDLGYRVIEVDSAHEALRCLEEGVCANLLITDHLMPGMTGTALAALVGEKQPHLPVLLISGYADAEGVAPGLARLTKPFRQAELGAAVTNLLRTSRP